MASAQVFLVGLGVDAGALPQFFLLLTSQLEPKRFGDLPRDVLLQVRQLAQSRPELFSPELRFGRRVDELGLNRQVVALLADAPGQNRARVQRHANRRRIGLHSLIAEHEAARHDAKPTQLGDAVDDALGDAVGQEFDGGISALIHEWQDPEGLAARSGLAAGADRSRSAEQRSQRHRHISSGVETSRGCALDRARHDCAQCLRCNRVEIGELGEAIVHQLGHDLLRRASGKERPPAQHLVEHTPEREDVRASVDRSPDTCSGDM